MILYESDEPCWYGTQAEAKASGHPFNKREVPTDKPGLLRWLNNNAARVTEPVTLKATYGETRPAFEEPSVQPDDNFEDLPLAQQLHLACLALENARSTLKGEQA